MAWKVRKGINTRASQGGGEEDDKGTGEMTHGKGT
jgi:hypothetical protein